MQILVYGMEYLSLEICEIFRTNLSDMETMSQIKLSDLTKLPKNSNAQIKRLLKKY